VIRRLLVRLAALALAEWALVGLSVWRLVAVPLSGSVLGVLLGGVLCVIMAQSAWDARLVTAFEDFVEQSGADSLGAAHGLRRRIGLSALYRVVALLLGAVVLSLLVGRLQGLGGIHTAALAATASAAGVLVEVWRPVVLGELLGERIARLASPVTRLRWARQTLSWRLQWAAVATGAAGIVGVALFVHWFIPLPRSVRQLLLAVFPFTVLLVALGWWLLVRRVSRSVVRFVAALGEPEAGQAAPPSGGGDAVPASAQVRQAEQVYRAAQVLPYTLAGLKVGAFGLGALLLYLEATRVLGADRDSAGMMALATFLISFAAGLYETFWHRAALREVLTDLATRFQLDVAAVRSPLSLRVKMFFGFGLVLLFACAISIFWSFVQVRNLAVTFVQKQSRLKAESILERVRTLDKLRGPLQPHDVTGILTQLSQAGEEVYWYLPPAGPPQGFSATRPEAPRLPFAARTRMRREASGVLRLGDLGLAGAFLRIRLGRRDLGSVAVLYPDQRKESTAPGPHTPVLAVFFVVVLLLSTGIVGLIASDLSAPLRVLEQRAGEMAQGDLGRAVAIGAEADEVGRLAFALDAMRKSLETQLRQVEELNVSLEEKVAQRTSDLARANADLREALGRLTRAQDQLVQSEKLASVGQLVAGVAHELNNPINAVGNTLGPLGEAVRALLDSGAPRGPGDAAPSEEEAARRQALVTDVESMLRILRNGTERVSRIVRALSRYARPVREPDASVDLGALVQETLEIASHLLSRITVEQALDAAPPVRGDRGELGQVITNLVVNAAQAVGDAPAGRIRIGVCRAAALTSEDPQGSGQEGVGQQVVVTVEDSGPGVPPEIRGRIFDPFFTTKAVGQGTGLGLSISHEIVIRSGGRIAVDDSPLGGARFRVWLPAALDEKGLG